MQKRVTSPELDGTVDASSDNPGRPGRLALVSCPSKKRKELLATDFMFATLITNDNRIYNAKRIVGAHNSALSWPYCWAMGIIMPSAGGMKMNILRLVYPLVN